MGIKVTKWILILYLFGTNHPATNSFHWVYDSYDLCKIDGDDIALPGVTEPHCFAITMPKKKVK